MARRPDGPVARSEHVSMRMRPTTALRLDQMRGVTPRSRFLEKLIDDEHKRRKVKDEKEG